MSAGGPTIIKECPAQIPRSSLRSFSLWATPFCGDECRAERALGCGGIFPVASRQGRRGRKRRREGKGGGGREGRGDGRRRRNKTGKRRGEVGRAAVWERGGHAGAGGVGT